MLIHSTPSIHSHTNAHWHYEEHYRQSLTDTHSAQTHRHTPLRSIAPGLECQTLKHPMLSNFLCESDSTKCMRETKTQVSCLCAYVFVRV